MLDMEREVFNAEWPQFRVWYQFHHEDSSRTEWHEEDMWKPCTLIRVDTLKERVVTRSFLYLCDRTRPGTMYEGTSTYEIEEQRIYLEYKDVYMYPHKGARMPVEWILLLGATCDSQ